MLTKGKYIHLKVAIVKDDYRELYRFTHERGWTLAYFVRRALEEAMRDKNLTEKWLRRDS